MKSAPFPWPILPALAVLWFAPAINRWFDRTSRPRPERPTPPDQQVTPTQVRITRSPASRELDRWDR